MAKIIKMPSGISIDLEKGEINSPMGAGPIPINRNSHSYSHSYRRTLWNRFDNFISDIGNWFAEYSENITSIIALILAICGGIAFLAWLISLGWIWGIVAGIFLGGIAYYALMFCIGVFIFIGNIALAIIRYIFYSGITFLITIAIAGLVTGISIYSSSVTAQSHTTYTHAEYVAPTTKYKCTANSVLNVRSAPNTYSKVLGTIKPGQIVEVYDTSNGFARIKYKNQDAYISEKYIIKVH